MCLHALLFCRFYGLFRDPLMFQIPQSRYNHSKHGSTAGCFAQRGIVLPTVSAMMHLL